MLLTVRKYMYFESTVVVLDNQSNENVGTWSVTCVRLNKILNANLIVFCESK